MDGPRKSSDVNRDRYDASHDVAEQLPRDTTVGASRNSDNPGEIKKVQLLFPIHNEADHLRSVVLSIANILESNGYELRILLVDDGSTDASKAVAAELSVQYEMISYISFSRNFGKEAAIMAGLNEIRDGFDVLVYMDSDGQHSPRDLVRLLEAAQEPDVDLVCGVRTDRDYQTSSQRLMTKAFYQTFHFLSNERIDEGVGDFNVLRPKVVRALRDLSEEHPFMKGLVAWVGFRRKLVPITIERRAGGSAKSSTRKMLKLAFGAILSFSSWPLRAWSVIGMSSAMLALLYLVIIVLDTMINGRDVPGYATTVILLLGLGGMQLLSAGIIGEYVARIYDAAKRRPRYIISERG